MSTIVVVRKNGFAAIAADTLTSWGSMRESAKYIANHEKIIRAGDSYLGIAGTASAQMLLQCYFEQREAPFALDTPARIFAVWRDIHRVLKEDYYLKEREDSESALESTRMHTLIANPNGIFMVDSYRHVQALHRFHACGSGLEYALGAMYALYERPNLSAEDIARAGVEAAAEFDDGTGLPMQSYSIPLRDE